MVGRELGRRVEVELGSLRDSTPPTGRIEGIDLVTGRHSYPDQGFGDLERWGRLEGILRFRTDGPSRPCQPLGGSRQIGFIVGRTEIGSPES